jgi:hypothetical protein
MREMRVVDFPTRYIVGRADYDEDFVFFFRADDSLREMILNAREHILSIKENNDSVNDISCLGFFYFY